MTLDARDAVEWLAMDAGTIRPDSPASNEEALIRALGLPEGDGAVLLAAVYAAVLLLETDEANRVGKAFIFGARLARHAADLERIGDRS